METFKILEKPRLCSKEFANREENSSRHNLQLYNISLAELSTAERRVKVTRCKKSKWSDTRYCEVPKPIRTNKEPRFINATCYPIHATLT